MRLLLSRSVLSVLALAILTVALMRAPGGGGCGQNDEGASGRSGLQRPRGGEFGARWHPACVDAVSSPRTADASIDFVPLQFACATAPNTRVDAAAARRESRLAAPPDPKRIAANPLGRAWRTERHP